MSTILQALQKQKQEQAGINALPIAIKPSNIKFKVALLLSSLVIISLLLVIITLLFTPAVVLRESPATDEVAVIESDPVEKTEAPKKSISNNVQQVSFTLKPLPQQHEVTAVSEEPAQLILVNDSKQPQLKPVETKKTEIKSESVKEIDYSEVSNDLGRRFAQALLMNDESQKKELVKNHTVEDENNDGSNINQMSSGFQEQVRAMSYDAHMYSSIKEQRWIRINSEELREGQFNDYGDIQVIEIQPRRTIFRLGMQSFSLEALTDWKGY